ncbi:lasso peptide biosynthesis B2 protein [Nocardiopsis synnemataformans]|uniref:lasso peptide biosynthesis B2 protein n=1 Tax=Nocardiopsis synnemataformans TaxID=61305 RepID=UPI003EBD0973
MNRPSTIAVDTGHAWVLVDYRTGRTELRTTPPDGQRLCATVRLGKQVPSWGTGETAAVLPCPPRRRPLWLLLCLPAVTVTAAALLLGPRGGRLGRLVVLASLGRRLPPASNGRVRAALDAVRALSAYLPGRWACLEQSVATAFLLALTGRRAEWRHGLATDPVRLHAWVADRDGHPVGEGPDISAYTPIRTTDGPVLGPTLEKTLE